MQYLALDLITNCVVCFIGRNINYTMYKSSRKHNATPLLHAWMFIRNRKLCVTDGNEIKYLWFLIVLLPTNKIFVIILPCIVWKTHIDYNWLENNKRKKIYYGILVNYFRCPLVAARNWMTSSSGLVPGGRCLSKVSCHFLSVTTLWQITLGTFFSKSSVETLVG